MQREALLHAKIKTGRAMLLRTAEGGCPHAIYGTVTVTVAVLRPYWLVA